MAFFSKKQTNKNTYSKTQILKLANYVKSAGETTAINQASQFLVATKPGVFAFSHISQPYTTVALFQEIKPNEYQVIIKNEQGKELLKLIK